MKLSIIFLVMSTLATLITASPVDADLEIRANPKLSQAAAAALLSKAGISSYSSGGCTNKNKPTCTSYEGVRTNTVNGAITLKKACACTITITGGTEVGHASGTYSHGNGYKFDFRKTTALNNYIKKNFKRIANRGDGAPQYKSKAGNIYADEGNHWDVTYY